MNDPLGVRFTIQLENNSDNKLPVFNIYVHIVQRLKVRAMSLMLRNAANIRTSNQEDRAWNESG